MVPTSECFRWLVVPSCTPSSHPSVVMPGLVRIDNPARKIRLPDTCQPMIQGHKMSNADSNCSWRRMKDRQLWADVFRATADLEMEGWWQKGGMGASLWGT